MEWRRRYSSRELFAHTENSIGSLFTQNISVKTGNISSERQIKGDNEIIRVIMRVIPRLNLKDLWNVLKTLKGLLKEPYSERKAHWLREDGTILTD